MTHDEALALAILALDAPLESGARTRLDSHLAACDVCRAELAAIQSAHEALSSWGAAGAPTPLGTPVTGLPRGDAARRWPSLIAAVVVGLVVGGAGGFAAGDRVLRPAADGQAAAAPDGRATFALLLEERADAWPPASPLMRPGYFEWRDTLVARGTFGGGERFAEDAGWYVAQGGIAAPMTALGTGIQGPVNFSGFFLVRARNYEDAVTIARSSPHTRYGGIVVRRAFDR